MRRTAWKPAACAPLVFYRMRASLRACIGTPLPVLVLVSCALETLAVTQARRALTALAIVVGFLSIAGAGGYAIMSARVSAEHQHTMRCLAAYMAFIQVVGGPEDEGIDRLRTCERSAIGEEPIHLGPSEHPFVVSKYEACLAAHLLMSADLDKSLAQQQQYCH